MQYRYYDDEGHYELNSFPGCSQVVVSNHVFIKPELRGKGRGQVQHKHRLQQAKEMGFDFIICTVKSDNATERAILAKNGWVKLADFQNSETMNHLEMWGRSLKDEASPQVQS